MAIQVHILTANGSVTDTRTGRTLGNLVEADYDNSCMLVVNATHATEYYIWRIDDSQEHGIVATVDETVSNPFGEVVKSWLEDLGVIDASSS